MNDDPNADLIGYELTMEGDPPTTWRVVATDNVLGAGFVQIRRVRTDASVDSHGMRVQRTQDVRRHKQITGAAS